MISRATVNRRQVLSILVVVIGLGLLGHICALPAAADWTHLHPAESHAPSGDHHSDGSLGASCDAVASTAPTSCAQADLSTAVLTDADAVEPVVSPRYSAALAFVAPRRAPDRSLFLLNASFLI